MGQVSWSLFAEGCVQGTAKTHILDTRILHATFHTAHLFLICGPSHHEIVPAIVIATLVAAAHGTAAAVVLATALVIAAATAIGGQSRIGGV